MRVKPWKGFWVVINAKSNALPWTLSKTKKGCISSLYEDMSPEQQEDLWGQKLRDGYSVEKVNVYFEAKGKLK